MALIDDVQKAYKAIYRTDLSTGAAQTVANAITGGGQSLDGYIKSLVGGATTGSMAAVAISTFINGNTPDAASIDKLTAFCNSQYDSYQKMGSANATLGPYEALGRAFSQSDPAGFAAKYGKGSDADFLQNTYTQVYGTPPNPGVQSSLQSQIDFFTKLYTGAGIAAADAALQARGAVLGQIVGYAFTDATSAAKSGWDEGVSKYMTDLAHGVTTGMGKPLAIVNGGGAGADGVNIVLAGTATEVVGPNQANPAFKSTDGNDTISGKLANGAKIDASGGTDKMEVTLVNAITETTKVSGTEVVKLGFTAGGTTADADAFAGVKELWSKASTASGTFNDIAEGTKLGIEKVGPVNNTFTFKSVVDHADLAIDAVSGGRATLSNVKDLGLHALSNSVFNGLGVVVGAETASITLDGSASLSLNRIAATNLKSFDASGLNGSLGVTYNQVNTDTTFKLSEGADIFTTDLQANRTMDIHLGGGADTLEIKGPTKATTLTNVSLDNGVVKTLASVDDFTKGADHVDLKTFALATDVTQFSAAQAQQIRSSVTLEQALTKAAGIMGTNKVAVFDFGGDSYVYHNDATAGLGTDDGLVKLAGITNLTVGTTADKDILFS